MDFGDAGLHRSRSWASGIWAVDICAQELKRTETALDLPRPLHRTSRTLSGSIKLLDSAREVFKDVQGCSRHRSLNFMISMACWKNANRRTRSWTHRGFFDFQSLHVLTQCAAICSDTASISRGTTTLQWFQSTSYIRRRCCDA